LANVDIVASGDKFDSNYFCFVCGYTSLKMPVEEINKVKFNMHE
jgi:hypothetical protein